MRSHYFRNDGPVRFLASVTSLAEARIAVASRADIIDAKNPATGALGALPFDIVHDIRRRLPSETLVSATIGDLPCNPSEVAEAARVMAATGIDYVKIGFFPGGDPMSTIAELGRCPLGNARIVGLLLADASPDLSLIPAMARAQFAGVMLDTSNKAAGRLTEVLPAATLARFVQEAAGNGLFSGLAGSLRVCDVAALMRLKPNVLGFRGALCAAGERTGGLTREATMAVRMEIDRWATKTEPRPRTSAAE